MQVTSGTVLGTVQKAQYKAQHDAPPKRRNYESCP